MTIDDLYKKAKRFHSRINGSTLEYNLKPYYEKLNTIKEYEKQLELKTDNQLKELSKKLAEMAEKDRSLDQLLFEAYALVSVAIKRVLKLRPFDTQLIGAIVIHHGKIAEIPTGEGKTLTALFPAFLNALTGNGVHILTFNDYLARRDAEWMGPVYELLGLKTGFIQEGMRVPNRKQAYAADILYLTAKEAGFDFLRDNLTYNYDDRVHRGFDYAIIDEADSILIDEARIPLVIASASDDYIKDSFRIAEIVRKLEMNVDLELDEYSRNIFFTEEGLIHVERLLSCDNMYDPENIDLLTQLNCAIHAEFLFVKDVDYIVRNKKIELVDEFTGRVADKRRWPDGLQAALEAKEKINVQSKGKMLNSITLQHFIRKYSKISGMTATAASAEEEFKRFYDLDIVVIPTHKPCIRIDHPDNIFKNKEAKYAALIKEIIKVHKTRRPVLVGTTSINESETISERLKRNGINCKVLNAKNDEIEAGIIAKAGKLDAVTISTNMAGRGTDIRLGDDNEREKKQIIKLGGLYVIGTNRHESRRIDNQLRGRAGRQGDPGSSRFFISFEDDLFIKYRLNALIQANAFKNNQQGEIENSANRKEMDRIQRIIEGQNLEIKKTLFKYSSLIEEQREIISGNRDLVLSDDSSLDFYQTNCSDKFNTLHKIFDKRDLVKICRSISLYFIDEVWSRYLSEIADIREGIHLTRLGYKEPVYEFYRLAINLFDKLLPEMESFIINKFNSIDTGNINIDMESLGIKAPSSTWTYLINDDPFEDMMATNFAGSMGLSTGAAFPWLWPFMLILPLLKRIKKKMRRSP